MILHYLLLDEQNVTALNKSGLDESGLGGLALCGADYGSTAGCRSVAAIAQVVKGKVKYFIHFNIASLIHR